MPSLVYLKNKKNGVTYVYENVSVWNKEKQRCDCKRTCIGKLDPQTGDFISNKAKIEKRRTFEVRSIGCTLLFDSIVHNIGLLKPLRDVFGGDADKILTCAYQQLCSKKPLAYVEYWQRTNIAPTGDILTSQKVSELLPTIDEGKQFDFFKRWINNQQKENVYLALDITSVSSYSEQNEFVRFGYNRDGEALPQINILMLMSEKSRLPLFYDVIPGSIHDVSTLKCALQQFKLVDAKKLHLVMDKGFYSKKNVDAMYNAKMKFIIGVSFTSNLAKRAVEEVKDAIDDYENYCEILGECLFVKSKLDKWNDHRYYVHVYFDSAKADCEYRSFLKDLKTWEKELRSGKAKKENQKYYTKYFKVKDPPARGKKIAIKRNEIEEFKNKQAGFFVIASNCEKDPVKALELYRDKDSVEKGFDDLKNTIDGKRLRVKSAPSMQGRLFIQFITLILAAHIRKVMKEYAMLSNHTMTDLVNELKTLQHIKAEGNKIEGYTALTKFQGEIFDAFGIDKQSYV